MTRACTCGVAWNGTLTGITQHFRDCASRLPDPDLCDHKTATRRAGSLFCTKCAKGLTEGGPAWLDARYAPGHGEKLRESAIAAKAIRMKEEERESTYDLSGIYLDHGITGLDKSDLYTLMECCLRELTARA